MGGLDYRSLVPRTPPEGLREWVLENCRSELDCHGLVYEAEYVRDNSLLQVLNEWPQPRKAKMVRVACSCCEESLLLNWGKDEKYGYGFVLPDDEEGDWAHTVTTAGDEAKCPICGERVLVNKRAAVRDYYVTAECQVMSADVIEQTGELVLTGWTVQRRVYKSGFERLELLPAEAYVFTSTDCFQLMGWRNGYSGQCGYFVQYGGEWRQPRNWAECWGREEHIFGLSPELIGRSCLPHCKLDVYMARRPGAKHYPVAWLRLYQARPSVEAVLLHGLPRVLDDLIAGKTEAKDWKKNDRGRLELPEIDWAQTRPAQMLHLTKEELRMGRAQDWGTLFWNLFVGTKRTGEVLTAEDIYSAFRLGDEHLSMLIPRGQVGKLNTAFEAAGYSTETAKAAYQDLYAVLGDSDNATESAQLLAKLAKSEEDVAKWGDIAAGVTGTFGDALPINSLIEASNETAKVGEVTGALADALNWVGISEDEFNEKLSASADESERTRLITETLSAAYQNASDIFRKNNEVLMEANRAQAELDDSMARLGGAVAEVKAELTSEFAPAISEVVDALVGMAEGADGADQAFMQAVDNLIGQATEKLPELLEFGADIIINVISGIANASPQLAEGAVVAITALVEGLVGALPQIAEAAAQLIGGLVSGLAEAAPELIPAAANAVAELVQAFVDNLPAMQDASSQLITALGDGLLDAIPVLLEATPEIISSLLDAILEGIPKVIEAGITLLGSLVEDLPTIIDTIVTVLPKIVSSISDTLLDDIPKIIEAGVKLLTSLVTDLPRIIAEIVRALPEIITGMLTELEKGISKFEDVVENLVRGLWDGIQSLASWLWNKVYGWISDIWDGITDFFGIASPSKEMAWIGEMLVEGLAGAVNKDGEKAVKAVKDMASDMLSEVQSETGKVNDVLANAAGQTIQFSTRDMEKELGRQKELIAEMEADFRSKRFEQAGRFDIQGLIQGAEAEKPKLAAAYAQAAQAALDGMAAHLPSTVAEPPVTALQDRQTSAIIAAVSSRGGDVGGSPIYIDKLVVREEADVRRIARELYDMARRESRGRGGGGL